LSGRVGWFYGNASAVFSIYIFHKSEPQLKSN
jgi:hypothetical protein